MKTGLLVFLLCFGGRFFAQQTPVPAGKNFLINGNFEVGSPGYSALPDQWENCGPRSESPPDLHGKNTRLFGVNTRAAEGKQFVGLVVRQNGTQECLLQNFPETLPLGTYRLRFAAAIPTDLKSPSRETGRSINYNRPVELRVLMRTDGSTVDDWAEVTEIDHSKWRYYELDLTVDRTVYGLVLMPAHSEPTPYSGAVLLDDVSLTKRADPAEEPR